MTVSSMMPRKGRQWGDRDVDDGKEEVVEVNDNDKTTMISAPPPCPPPTGDSKTAQTFSMGRHAYCLIQQSRFSRMAPYHLHSCPLRVKFWYSCCCSWQEIAANI